MSPLVNFSMAFADKDSVLIQCLGRLLGRFLHLDKEVPNRQECRVDSWILLFRGSRHVSGTSYSCHAVEDHVILTIITTQFVVLLCHCRHQSLLAVCGYASVLRDTSDERGLASALDCEASVTVIGLCSYGVLRGENKSSSPVQVESTVTQFTSCCSLKV